MADRFNGPGQASGQGFDMHSARKSSIGWEPRHSGTHRYWKNVLPIDHPVSSNASIVTANGTLLPAR